MAIDMKEFEVGVRRLTEFSTAYVKNNPFLPVVIIFIFILYVFLRSLLVFLVFAIPIFIFIAFAFRLIFRIHQQNLKNAKGDSYTYNISSRRLTPSIAGRNIDNRGYSYAHAQSVRRRNSKKNEMHVHFQDEKDITSSIVNDKAPHAEETLKEIREVEVGSAFRNNRCKGKMVIFEGGNSDEDEKKAIEWTCDDQKNLNDIGFSEMERNKRLESLMAKRKARKLLTLQVRRSLMNIKKESPLNEIASILIPRNKSSEALVSPTPCSAPSVLLPAHNPFDIPYDPQEEKPNLTGGFQEDSVVTHNKDAVFCRHESFSLGTISPGPWELYSPSETSHHLEYAIRPVTRDIPEFSRFRKQSDKKDLSEQTEKEVCQEKETARCTDSSHNSTHQSESLENALDSNCVHNGDGKKENDDESKLETYDIHESSSSSSSSEINTPFSTANKDEILRSLSFSLRKNVLVPELDNNVRTYYENSSTFDEKQGDDQKGMYDAHTRSQSIASDLQVELSEVGSQITNLSSDGESLEYRIEGNSGNEEVWVASSQLKKVEENEARSGEVREVSEQDIIEVGFSRINQDIEEPVSLESSEGLSGDFDKVHEEIFANNDLAFHQNNVENLEERFVSEENIATDEMIVYEIIDQKDLVNDDEGIIDLIQDTYGEDLDCMDQETSQDLSAPMLIDSTKSINITKGNHTQPESSISVKSLEGRLERESEPKLVAESDFMGNNHINSQVREVVAENGPSEASSSTSTTEDKVSSILPEKTTVEIGLVNITNVPEINNGEGQSLLSNDLAGISKFNPSLVRPIDPVMFLGIDPSPIAVVPEVAVEEVSLELSPPLSPNSVLQHKFSVDNLASNMSFDDIQMAAQQSNIEMEENDNLALKMSFDDICMASQRSNVEMEQIDNFPEEVIAEQNHVEDSVGLQQTSVPLINCSGKNSKYGAGDEPVEISDNEALIGPIRPTE